MLHPRKGRHERPPDYVIPIGRSVIVPANGSLSNIVLTPQSMPRIRRVFAEERFDVVHVHEPLAPIVSFYALTRADVPIVSTSHSSGDSMRWNPVAKAFFGCAIDRIDHKIAVSERARDSALPILGDPIEVLPNGVVIPPEADPTGREPHVVFIGRHEPRKGLAVLLRAWPEVTRKTGARLRVVGADPLSVKWLMRRNGLEDTNIDLLGSIPEQPLDRRAAQSARPRRAVDRPRELRHGAHARVRVRDPGGRLGHRGLPRGRQSGHRDPRARPTIRTRSPRRSSSCSPTRSAVCASARPRGSRPRSATRGRAWPDGSRRSTPA